MAGKKLVIVSDARGGRNGTDHPLAIGPDQCIEALNVDWFGDALLGRKRNGSTAVTDTGGTAFSSGMQSVFRHVPGNDETAAELWGIDGAATPIVKRMTGGTNFADVSLDDAISATPQLITAASLNGKLFLAYDSAQDRLHVYDPSLAAPRVRRVGLAASSAPTVANTGAGAYAATLRYYKQDTIQLNGAIVVRRSELSTKVSFTPSGAGTAARVTQGALPGEGETHWRVWGSADDATYYNLSGNVAVGTTTYDDSAAPSSYNGNTAQDVSGTYSLPPSAKYIITDGNRLLMVGAYEASGAQSGGKNSRIWFTPVLGSSDQGDDERTRSTSVQKDYVDVNENDGGAVTALGILESSPYVFKYRQHYRLVPTGDVSTPYLPRRKSNRIGCIAQKTVVEAEDEQGRSALYFMSHRGPYRVSANGLQYLGRDNEDIWKTMNLAATTVVGHAVYHADIHQLWFWIATGSSNDPDTKMMFDVWLGKPDERNQVRGGWAKHTGPSAAARCSTMFSNTLGATMSRDLKPYIGRATGTAIWKCDSSATNDAGTTFQAYVKKAITPASQLGINFGLGQVSLMAKAATGVTITQTIDRDFGFETRTATVSLTASGSESRVLRKIEGSDMAGAGVLHLQIGDAAAADNNWTLDALVAPVEGQEFR